MLKKNKKNLILKHILNVYFFFNIVRSLLNNLLNDYFKPSKNCNVRKNIFYIFQNKNKLKYKKLFK